MRVVGRYVSFCVDMLLNSLLRSPAKFLLPTLLLLFGNLSCSMYVSSDNESTRSLAGFLHLAPPTVLAQIFNPQQWKITVIIICKSYPIMYLVSSSSSNIRSVRSNIKSSITVGMLGKMSVPWQQDERSSSSDGGRVENHARDQEKRKVRKLSFHCRLT